MTPDPLRAVAERLARDVYERTGTVGWPFSSLPAPSRSNLTEYVLAGLTHAARPADRTAEREAARKAWDAAVEVPMSKPSKLAFGHEIAHARDRYLAAEFDAGERVTPTCERCGGMMLAHEREFAHHGELATCVDFLAATVKRLAEQRGAER